MALAVYEGWFGKKILNSRTDRVTQTLAAELAGRCRHQRLRWRRGEPVQPDRSGDARRPEPDHRAGWRRDPGAQRRDADLCRARPDRGRRRRDTARMSGVSAATTPGVR